MRAEQIVDMKDFIADHVSDNKDLTLLVGDFNVNSGENDSKAQYARDLINQQPAAESVF